MGIVIGASTTVSFRGSAGSGSGCFGATQAQWNYSTNVQRLYQLGDWVPCDDTGIATQTLSLTFYTPAPGGSYDVTPDQACVNSTLPASVSPGGCNLGDTVLSGQWFLTGYSYSKSAADQPGTETWSLMQYTGGDDDPDYNLRGLSEGTITSSYSIAESESLTGIDLGGTVGDGISVGYQGSASAGQITREDQVFSGTAGAVGGGISPAGKIASGNVSIQHTPIWDS